MNADSVHGVIAADARAALASTLAWSRARDYHGHTKHDALASPLLWALCGWGKWPRLLAIQAVMRSPVNLRPLLGVPKTCNPKGLALFVHAHLDRHAVNRTQSDLDEAQRLLQRLMTMRSPGRWRGLAWGYPYPWQDLGFFAPANTPNAVVTAFICEAFLHAHAVTGLREWLEVVAQAIPFFLGDLRVLKDTPDELCLSYMPVDMRMRVMDVSILIGSVLAGYERQAGDRSHHDTARRLVNYVVRRQTEYAAWFYTDPPADSPVCHDNYHTGFILDALWRYMQATGDRGHEEAYYRGLRYYHDHLFNADGSPRWMSDRDYPHDIHGAAQGIITFARHGDAYPGTADRIVAWALRRMYHPAGRFYYQETPWYRKKFTLMRWCNAWMARALAHYLRCGAET